MIPVGTIAWASIAPGFNPPNPHPILVLKDFPNGNLGVAFVTHSDDLLRLGLPLLRKDVPSAFRDHGGPLTDESGVLALVDDRGHRRIVIAEPRGSDRLSIGTAEVVLTYSVSLPAAEWKPLQARIRSALRL